MYQLAYIEKSGKKIEYIKHITATGATLSIPIDMSNSDYQNYLKWIDEGNEPLLYENSTE